MRHGKENDRVSATSQRLLLARVRRRLRRVAASRRPEPIRPTSPPVDPVYPDVVEEHTNVGPMMDALVMRAKRRQKPLGVDRDYDVLRENFDHWTFMLQAQWLHDRPEIDPIQLFRRNGAGALTSPNYNFSMKTYLQRYPEKKDGPERTPYLEWIKRGRAAGEIADPAHGIEQIAGILGLEPGQVVDELVATRTDMMERLRTGTLGEMFAKAAEIEPLIGPVWTETTRTRMLPLVGKLIVGQVAAIHACQESAGFRRARLVVVTEGPHQGGDRPLQSHLAHALAGMVVPDDIVVIYTEAGGKTAHGTFPAGVREVDFAAAAEGLPDEHKQQALVSLLRSFRADAIVNNDSPVMYRLLTSYGKALASSERIFLCFHHNQQQAQGSWTGWSLKWFYAGFDFVSGFITDSDYLRDQLTEMYQLSEGDRERVHVFRAPVDPSLAATVAAQEQSSRRPVVYWAGRWDRQKRGDIALEVARRMPDIDFRFWNEAPLDGDQVGEMPDNVRLEGPYGDISSLDLSQADAWLYTSAWDGVPSVLLEVAMTEVPIVGSLVGGVGEVLSDENSWPIIDWQDPDAYEKALRDILSDPEEARRRSHSLRERLERDRTQRDYAEYAAQLLLNRTDSAEETR